MKRASLTIVVSVLPIVQVDLFEYNLVQIISIKNVYIICRII